MLVGVNTSSFTATELRIVAILMDGQLHTKGEILGIVFDSMATEANLYPHITNIRNKIKDSGLLLNFVIANGRRTESKGYQLSRRLCHE